MSEIEQLSSRVMSAMDRIARGMDSLTRDDGGASQALKKELDQEKSLNAELSERVKAMGERQEHALAAMEVKAAEAAERMTKLDTEMQQMRKSNEMLAEACEALRKANAEGVGEPDLINNTMAAELEAMRAMRRAEIAEADEIMAGLLPLLNASAQTTASEETH